MKIQINDCTLRDGGYIFGKNPPAAYVNGIINGLLASDIDIIEIGFLQNQINSETVVYKNSKDCEKYIKPEYSSRFTGFCDNSRYSIDNLDEYDGKSFEYFRISFAKHEIDSALEFVKGAKQKGYKVFANPMDAPSYTDDERKDLIDKINKIKPYAFSIVDTFGCMYLEDLKHIFSQFDVLLDKEIFIGLHSHNNLQLSNALAEVMIDLAIKSDRNVVVDASLYSMGRGAGNASTEVIASYLNQKHGYSYNLLELFKTIDNYVIPYSKDFAIDSWGYNIPMLICGMFGAHVDNMQYLGKHGVTSSYIKFDIINRLTPSQRKRYGKGYSKSNFTDLENVMNQITKD